MKTYGYGYGYKADCKKGRRYDTPHKNKYSRSAIPVHHLHPIFGPEMERRITKHAKKTKATIYGSAAFNAQVPKAHRKDFTDIDMLAFKNKRNAISLERKLDKEANCNIFYVDTLKCNGTKTYRVQNKAWIKKQTVADVSPHQKIPTNTVNNIKYETIQQREKEVIRMLNTPGHEYRREKDLAMLRRIQTYKKHMGWE